MYTLFFTKILKFSGGPRGGVWSSKSPPPRLLFFRPKLRYFVCKNCFLECYVMMGFCLDVVAQTSLHAILKIGRTKPVCRSLLFSCGDIPVIIWLFCRTMLTPMMILLQMLNLPWCSFILHKVGSCFTLLCCEGYSLYRWHYNSQSPVYSVCIIFISKKRSSR